MAGWRIGGAWAGVSACIVFAAPWSFGGCSENDADESGHGGGTPAPTEVQARSPVEELRSVTSFAARVDSAIALERDGAKLVRAAPGPSPLRVTLPARANGAVRLELPRTPGAWIEITADHRDVMAEIDERVAVYRMSKRDTDTLMYFDQHRFEEAFILRTEHAPAETRYVVRHGSGIRELRAHEGRIEALDRKGRVAFTTEPAFAVDRAGTRRDIALTLEGTTVVASLDTRELAFPIYCDPSWTFGSPTAWPEEVIVGLNSIWLRQNSSTTGTVAVIDAAPGPTLDSQVEATIGLSALLNGAITANRVRVKVGGHVTGDAHYNELTNNGTIDGALLTPLSLPLPIVVPSVPSITPGTSPADDITLAQSADVTLEPGNYGLVKLLQGTNNDPTVLTLSGGVYHLLELDIGQDGRVECAGACELRIQGKLRPGQDAYVGPSPSSSLTAADVVIFVTGVNGSTGALGATPKAAEIGIGNEIEGRLFAPSGTLLIKDTTVATGTFIALDVQAGLSTTITKDTSAPPTEPDCTAYCQDLIAAGCSNGPSSQSQCESECEDALGADFCAEQFEALVVCANTIGTVQCDAEDDPIVAGCESESSDFDTCETVCAEADDDNPCTDDICNCSLASCDPQPPSKIPRARQPARARTATCATARRPAMEQAAARRARPSSSTMATHAPLIAAIRLPAW